MKTFVGTSLQHRNASDKLQDLYDLILLYCDTEKDSPL